jgi:hypothetical protein
MSVGGRVVREEISIYVLFFFDTRFSKQKLLNTVLRSIVEFKHDVMNVLVDWSSLDDLEQRGPVSQTALIVAAQWGNEKAVETLLDRGSQVNIRDEDGMTPLMWSSKEGHWKVLRRLLESGKVDVFMKDKCGRSAHDWFLRGNVRRESCCPGCGRTSDPNVTAKIRSMLLHSTDKAKDRKRKSESNSSSTRKHGRHARPRRQDFDDDSTILGAEKASSSSSAQAV